MYAAADRVVDSARYSSTPWKRLPSLPSQRSLVMLMISRRDAAKKQRNLTAALA